MTTERERSLQGKLFLIGPRASGKTSLGALLSQRLMRPFVDADAVAVARAGESIADLVEREGWPAFRKLEREVLREICRGGDLVAATGGGVVLDPDNRRLLKESGVVVLLWAEPEVLLQRLARQRLAEQRPALTELPWEEEMRRTLEERRPLYLECAHLTLDATQPLEVLANGAVDRLARWRP